MPELPEVQTVLDGVSRVLQSSRIMGLDSYYPGTVKVDPDLGDDPFPAAFKEAIRRGKYMILHLANSISLIVHLRMTGKLVYEENAGSPHKHERARILLEGSAALRFIDPRTFGKITLLKTNNLSSFLPKLGPEPLSDNFQEDHLLKTLKNRQAPIKNLLLDQRIVAGLGNIYVCELLYRSGIRPDRPGGRISKKNASDIVKHSRDVLSEALAVGGTSISDYRQVDDKSGEFQNFLKVYQKKLCPKGHEVQNLRLAGRSSFFCPICQRR